MFCLNEHSYSVQLAFCNTFNEYLDLHPDIRLPTVDIKNNNDVVAVIQEIKYKKC